MKITIIGAGYVGLSNALLLAQNNDIILLDINKEKIDMINNRISPIKDLEMKSFLGNKVLNLIGTMDKDLAFKDADYVIVSTPTDYDSNTDRLDTGVIEKIIKNVLVINPETTIVIRSTIPIGYTLKLRQIFGKDDIIFSPEFLREGQALHDSLYPSRIIVGDKTDKAKLFANLLLEGAYKKDVPIIFVNPCEAEAIKLFSNAYLAMRVAFFNEVDTYGELTDLNTKEIINGIGLDLRIGNHYNNPSFGYGGYCLPKDTKELKNSYEGMPQRIISAIVESNELRKDHIANVVISKNPKTVGIHRLTMKKDSDNFRSSAILGVIERLYASGINIVIYEPLIKEDYFNNYKVMKNLDEFKAISDIILTNRIDEEIKDVKKKVYTRDLFENN